MKYSSNIHYEHTSATTFFNLANVLLVPWVKNELSRTLTHQLVAFIVSGL